jgi:dethiobiotin synthetase
MSDSPITQYSIPNTRRIFITGIGTGVGKTIVSAIVTEALQADYWKPIQTGSGDDRDSDTVRNLISNKKTIVHPEAFLLPKPASPFAAAEEEGIKIEMKNIAIPKTDNILVIEGAGGLMVPINENELMIDMMELWEAEVILVSQNYLGSINHTMLSCMALADRKLKVLGIVYNGEDTLMAERSVLSFCDFPVIGRIKPENVFTPEKVSAYAKRFSL